MKFENKHVAFTPRPLFEDKELQDKLFEKKVNIVDEYRPKEIEFSDV